MHQSRFRALITLDPAAEHVAMKPPPFGQYAKHTHALMIRAHGLSDPGLIRTFSAEVSWDEDCPLCPGDSAKVTITVTDDDASAYLATGQRFTLWCGDDIGHGIISRKVFTEYSPS